MRARIPKRLPFSSAAMIGTLTLLHSPLAQATDLSGKTEEELRASIVEQTQRLDTLRQQIAEESAKLDDIRRALGIDTLGRLRGGTSPQGQGEAPPPAEVAQAPQPQPVGQAPDSSPSGSPPKVAQIFEQPGVLTPRGKIVLEPGLQYSYSSSSRVSLVGYTIIPALTIGLIDVREVRRNTFTAALTGRWGITNRFELEAKIPYVHRSDDVLSRPINSGAANEQLFSSTGSGIGDVEMTGRYQLNDGGPDRPFYVGTLRFKSRTGKDPFKVLTNTMAPGQISNELQEELPRGSGFYTLQPGITALYPADPAVFFGSISYQYNFKRSNVTMNTTNGPVELGEIKPGDVIGFNFGMGLALNDRSSFSIGYDHASVGRTRQNGHDAINSVRTELGTLLLGYSHKLDKNTSLNLSVGAGITRDTPDVTLSLRLPMTF